VSPKATKFEFILPRGYLDENGRLHRTGVMRVATARDELEPLRDPSINGPDDPHLTIVVLSRVIVSLGTMTTVSTGVIGNLYASDLACLQNFYAVNFGDEEKAAPTEPRV
jgi:hypothetical protein